MVIFSQKDVLTKRRDQEEEEEECLIRLKENSSETKKEKAKELKNKENYRFEKNR